MNRNIYNVVTIRPATPADAEELLKIYSPFITDTAVSFETEIPSVEDFSERIKNIAKKYPYLVCEAGDKIVGYAYASPHRPRAAYRYSVDISVYIEPSYHRRGIGKALYTKLFELLRNQNIYTVYAGIALPNDASIGLHKSMGFAEIGIYHKVGYKNKKWHDVIWLEKALREYDVPERNIDITIRLAVPADAPDMAEVLARSWEVAYKDIIPADFIKERNATRIKQFRIPDENNTFYVIQTDGKTVGSMRIVDRPNVDDISVGIADLESIYLHPDYFRQGIGTIAMEFAYKTARSLGKTIMTVWVLAENANAIKFYEKCGFIADGNKRIWEYGKSLDGIRMRRGL